MVNFQKRKYFKEALPGTLPTPFYFDTPPLTSNGTWLSRGLPCKPIGFPAEFGPLWAFGFIHDILFLSPLHTLLCFRGV